MEFTEFLRGALAQYEQKVLEIAERADATGMAPAEFRRMVAGLKAAGNELSLAAFTALAVRQDGVEEQIVHQGSLHRYKLTAEKEWLTPWGKTQVARRVYQPDRGGPCAVPLDEGCGMVDRFMTPDVERVTSLMGARLTPGEVAQTLVEVFPDGPSTTAIQHVLEKVGQQAEDHAAAVETALSEQAPLNLDGDTLVVGWDGTNMPLRQSAPHRGRPPERPGVRDQEQAATAWKEAGVGMVSVYQTPLDPLTEPAERVDVRYYARVPERKMARLVGSVVEQTEAAVQAGSFTHKVFLADGAREIWRTVQQQEVFADFTLILDFYHAAEHLSTASEWIFGKGASEAKHWYNRWRRKLLEEPGAATALVRSVHRYCARCRKGTARHKALTREAGYFRANAKKMDYATYRAAGIPISSGPVEAACKTIVGHRLKRSGMRWSLAGAQRILNLRVPLQSKRWDAFWKWYLQHTDQLSKAA
jgi:hypothetical protein|tara:strand:+ start:115 stop:1536 length:1422 start_codon:yes stop_codon:yes gene_type:complete